MLRKGLAGLEFRAHGMKAAKVVRVRPKMCGSPVPRCAFNVGRNSSHTISTGTVTRALSDDVKETAEKVADTSPKEAVKKTEKAGKSTASDVENTTAGEAAQTVKDAVTGAAKGVKDAVSGDKKEG